MADQQDMRRLGGLINFLPFTYTIILIGSLSLMAIPFLTGFYSKDLILESGYGHYTFSGHIVYWLGTLTAIITAFYSFRLISMTFLTYPNAPKGDYIHTHEQPMIVVIPLVILAFMSIFFGYIAKDCFVGMGSDMLSAALFVHPSHIVSVEAEFSIPTLLKLLPAIGTVVGGALALLMYHRLATFTIELSISTAQGQLAGVGKQIYTFLNGKWYLDPIINYYIIGNSLSLGGVTNKVLDRGIIELIGPFGITESLFTGSRQISILDTSIITDYALYIMIGLLTIILIAFSALFGIDNRIIIILITCLLLL